MKLKEFIDVWIKSSWPNISEADKEIVAFAETCSPSAHVVFFDAQYREQIKKWVVENIPNRYLLLTCNSWQSRSLILREVDDYLLFKLTWECRE